MGVIRRPRLITDADIPGAIARDSEYIAADNAHTNAADPHPVYLTQAEGDGRYIGADNAHTNAADPHPVYLTQIEGDGRYRQTAAGVIGLSGGTLVSESGNAGLQAQSRDEASAAYISLHRPGIFATHFGIDIDNQLKIGGWSLGSTNYRIFHEGMLPLFKMPLVASNIAGNSFSLSWNSVESGLGIAEFCNYSGNGGGDAFNFFRMSGISTQAPTIANRIGRIDVYGSYLQTSDKRVKSDFLPAPGINAILALSPQKYKHWECLGFDNDKKALKLGKLFSYKIGFIAQEVQKIIPEAVRPTITEDELHSIDYNIIVACAIQAIQDLESQMRELRSQLQTISKKVM